MLRLDDDNLEGVMLVAEDARGNVRALFKLKVLGAHRRPFAPRAKSELAVCETAQSSIPLYAPPS